MKGKRLVAIAAVAAMVLMASASHAEVNFQFRTVVLTVPGLTQSLAPHVIEILGEVEGVQLVQTDVAARTVTVTYAASETVEVQRGVDKLRDMEVCTL